MPGPGGGALGVGGAPAISLSKRAACDGSAGATHDLERLMDGVLKAVTEHRQGVLFPREKQQCDYEPHSRHLISRKTVGP